MPERVLADDQVGLTVAVEVPAAIESGPAPTGSVAEIGRQRAARGQQDRDVVRRVPEDGEIVEAVAVQVRGHDVAGIRDGAVSLAASVNAVTSAVPAVMNCHVDPGKGRPAGGDERPVPRDDRDDLPGEYGVWGRHGHFPLAPPTSDVAGVHAGNASGHAERGAA